VTRAWIEAAIVLGNDPTAKVRCPVCADAELAVSDVYPTPEAPVFERYMQCPTCKARNVMRMNRR